MCGEEDNLADCLDRYLHEKVMGRMGFIIILKHPRVYTAVTKEARRELPDYESFDVISDELRELNY